jgi:curved DNA-binding protein CbpA
MKTLYDLLGARPDDDAEGLRSAFRQAAKANHPDLHAGDRDAPTRFRQIVQAYDILRDAEQRATYDRLLEFEREQLRSKSKRAISYVMHNIVSDAIAVVGLAIVLGGGYTLFAYTSKTPIDGVKRVEVTARGPAEIAAVRLAVRSDATEPDQLRDKLERMAVPAMPIVLSAIASDANDGGAPEVKKGEPAPSTTGLNTELAKPNNGFDVPRRQADAKTAADHPEKNHGIEPLDQGRPQSVEIQFSSPEKDNGVPKSSLSDFAMSDDKRDMKIPDTHDINTNDMKTPEMKIPAKPRMVAKLQAKNRITFEQASLENRNTSTCSGSQSCSGNIPPPLFGVGF